MGEDTRTEVTTGKGLVVLYDGFCPVCRRSAEIIRSLDILNILFLKRYQDFEIRDLPVPLEKITKRIQACDSGLMTCHEGIDAFTAILIRIPPLFLFAAATKMLSILRVGQRVYDYISENRYNLPLSGITAVFMRSQKGK